jgi:hypothetical protein
VSAVLCVIRTRCLLLLSGAALCLVLKQPSASSGSEDALFFVLPFLRTSTVKMQYRNHVAEAGHAALSAEKNLIFFLTQWKQNEDNNQNTIGRSSKNNIDNSAS